MATFADHALEQRRRLLQSRKPKADRLSDLAVAPGSASAGQAASVGAQGVRPGALRPGTVSGVTIRNGTITANHIVTHSLTADQIEAGSITADRLDAGTITADTAVIGAIISGFITTQHLTAGTIDAGEIHAYHIDTDSITASNAVLDAIEAGFIRTGGLAAGSIMVGSIAVGEIASGTINASQFNIGGSTSVATAQIRALDMADHVRATMDASGFNTYDAAGNVMWSANTGVSSIGIQPHVVGTIHIVTPGLGSDGIGDYAILTDHIYAGAVGAGAIAANAIVANHVQAQTFTGLNIYASGFSNNASDPLKKFVLDVNGIHIRTSGSSGYSYLDFFDGAYASRGYIEYDYYSGTDMLVVFSQGSLSLVGNQIYCASTAKINGHCRIIGGVLTAGEFQCEGSQGGLYLCIRFTAAASGHWYGTGLQFRGRRVDGGGAGAPPSSLTVQSTLQNSGVTAWDYVSLTSYGAMVSVGSTRSGDCYYAVHATTN